MNNNNSLGVKENRYKCKSFFELYSNSLLQQKTKSRDAQQYQSLCQPEDKKNEQLQIRPKRSVQYNSIQMETNQIENYSNSLRRQSTEPKNNQKRRNNITKTKILSYIDLLKSCEIDNFINQNIPIEEIKIKDHHQNSDNRKSSLIYKENQKENNVKLPVLKKDCLQFDKIDFKVSQSKLMRFGESFVTPFFGTKKPISLEKRPCEFQGVVYKRKK
ncbi:unnamed protein product [Paramecium sonneborni]|uniref:Uncharacterized protein n=1 Tax=Paramecium sonneborni TaxID=65129 RepID=A0A8S1R059_9CILI|nr:unnamed protein product [Paramecium sonneborni]